MEEAFMDVRGLERISGEPPRIAERLRIRVAAELRLPISVGVARSKFMAKMASRAAKPDGLVVIEPDRELDFLLPLPVESLWGVGPASAARLHAHAIRTVADAAAVERELLVEILGKAAGSHIHALAHNRDRRRVRAGRRRSSVGAQSALGRGPHTPAHVDTRLVALVERVTRRMRKAGRVGRTVTLRLRFGDYSRATRSSTLEEPTAASEPVLAVVRSLLGGRPPADRAARAHARRHCGEQPGLQPRRRPAGPAVPRPQPGGARPRPRRGARPLRSGGAHPGGTPGPRRALIRLPNAWRRVLRRRLAGRFPLAGRGCENSACLSRLGMATTMKF